MLPTIETSLSTAGRAALRMTDAGGSASAPPLSPVHKRAFEQAFRMTGDSAQSNRDFQEFYKRTKDTEYFAADFETTGLKATSEKDPDRVVSFGMVPLQPRSGAAGEGYEWIINPGMPIPRELARKKIHFITDEVVQGKPRFADVASQIATAVSGKTLVFHNADFDVKFFNAELARLPQPLSLNALKTTVACTLKMVRDLQPPKPNKSLDSLAKRYGVNLETRKNGHGAKIDSEILAAVVPHVLGEYDTYRNLYGERIEECDKILTATARLSERGNVALPSVSVSASASNMPFPAAEPLPPPSAHEVFPMPKQSALQRHTDGETSYATRHSEPATPPLSRGFASGSLARTAAEKGKSISGAVQNTRRGWNLEPNFDEFGNYVFNFGKHNGKTLDLVPTSYLQWAIEDIGPELHRKTMKILTKEVARRSAELSTATSSHMQVDAEPRYSGEPAAFEANAASSGTTSTTNTRRTQMPSAFEYYPRFAAEGFTFNELRFPMSSFHPPKRRNVQTATNAEIDVTPSSSESL